jgi:hypothetical protein
LVISLPVPFTIVHHVAGGCVVVQTFELNQVHHSMLHSVESMNLKQSFVVLQEPKPNEQDGL